MADAPRTLSPAEIKSLDIASARVAAGTPGAATTANAGDLANIKYATEKLGYKYSPTPAVITSQPAKVETQKNMADLNNLTPPPPIPTKAPPAPLPQTDYYSAEKSKLQTEIETQQALIDSDTKAFTDLIEQQRSRLNEAAQGALNSITSAFGRRKEEMAITNQARLGGQKIFEERFGRSRYAPELAMSNITAEEKAGIQRIADLDAQEQEALSAARQAAADKDFNLLSMQMSVAREARKEKNDLTLQLANQVREYDQLTMQKRKAALEEQAAYEEQNKDFINASREGAILGLIQQGESDPSKIFDYINYDESGKQVGDISLKEITDTMKALADAKKDPGKYQIVGGPKEGLYSIQMDETGKPIGMTQLIAPSAEMDDMNKPLSPSEIKTLRDLGYEARPGMTLGDASTLEAGLIPDSEASTPLTPTEIKTLLDLGYQVNYGMTRGQAQELGAPTGGLATRTTENAPVLDGLQAVSPWLTAQQQESLRVSIKDRLARGDVNGAKEIILQTAISALPVEQKNKAFGRNEALGALENIKTRLGDYTSKGGDTGIISGTVEKALEKIGRMKDPALARIANDIMLAIVDYRRAVSGAAFTESEGKAYEAIFPSIGNIPDLNAQKIASLEDSFNRNQKSNLSTVLGGNVYEALKQKAADIPTKAPRQMSYLDIESFARLNPEWKPYAIKIAEENPDLADQDIIDILMGSSPGFKKVGSDTYGASSLQKLKQSLIEQESGGNYKAIGLSTPHGKALGKYQIIPKFHFSKIGLNPNSEADKQKFLNSPALQDKLFGTIIDGLAKQYKNDPKKIAAAYYGGGGGAAVVGTPAGNKKQTAGGKTMPSINEYARSVLSRIG